MNALPALPHYEDDLAAFLGDLRSLVFTSQSKVARYLELSHTTISRYESGHLLPPAGYIACLAYLIDERLSKGDVDASARQDWLLSQVNEAFRWNYADVPLLQDWNELKQVAQSYMHPHSGERRVYSVQSRRVDWGEAPDVSVFYGREKELSQLNSLILDTRCRLIVVAGMGGIGKTFTVTKLAHEVEKDFKYVVWRSLRNAPMLEDTIQELGASLLASSTVHVGQSVNQQILRILEFIRSNRCLIVLDNLESIMETGTQIGEFRSGYEDYREFLNLIATTQHQSCMLLTSRDIPTEFSGTSDSTALARSYHLSGLTVTAAESIVAQYGVSGSLEALDALNKMYSGNPMALKLVSETIGRFFGADIHQFLHSDSTVFNDIRRLIDQAFNRLPALSQEVLYWLAIERQPCSLSKLASRLIPARPIGELIDVLDGLQKCSLVECADQLFYIPNVVSEYIIDRLIHQLYEALSHDDLTLMHRLAFITVDSADYVRQTQIRLLVKPLAGLLLAEDSPERMRERFEGMIRLMRSSYAATGYAPGNLLNLMAGSNHAIVHYDFSGLTIRHAYLTKVVLKDVDFSRCALLSCVFDNTFVGINTIAISRQAQFLALASGDEIRVWRLADRQPYRILDGHRDLIWNLVFAHDDNILFSRDANHTVHRWNIQDSRIELTIQLPNAVRALAVSQDATLIATGGDAGIIYLWDGQTGQPLTTLKSTLNSSIRAMAFTDSAQSLAVGDDEGRIAVWNLAQGKEIAVFDGHTEAVTSLTFTQHDELLVSSGFEGSIHVWDMNSLSHHTLLHGHEDIVSAVKARSDGKLLTSSSYDGTIKIWDMRRRIPQFILQGHELPVSAIDLDATGNILVSGSYDRTVRVWDTHDGRLIEAIQGLTFDLRTLAFNADSQFIAAGSSDYHVYVWDTQSGTRVQMCKGHVRWVAAVAFNPHRNLFASGGYDRTVRLWKLDSSKELAILKDHKHWVVQLAFSPDGQFLASASVDQTIRLWTLDSYESILTLEGHENTVTSISFHPHDPILASAGKDKTVRLWNLETGELMAVMPAALVDNLTFDASGEWLIGASQDGCLTFWDVASGKIVDEWLFSDNLLHVVALNASAHLLASARKDRVVTIWDYESRQQLHRLHTQGGPISSLTFDQRGERLASGSVDGFGHIWDVQSGGSIRTFKMNRPYEGMNITGTTGISTAQREILKSLGAIDQDTLIL